jgi:maltodextrin utilization protein YvdJ
LKQKTSTKIYNMKKSIVLLFLLSLILMTSCKSKTPIIQKEITNDTIIETLHDTIFSVEKDSSYYNALLECQNGKVAVKSVTNTSSGRKLNTPKISIHDNQLKVDCYSEAETLFAFWKNKFIKSYKGVEIPVITNELTWFQTTQIYIGRFLLFVLVLLILLKIFKFKYL